MRTRPPLPTTAAPSPPAVVLSTLFEAGYAQLTADERCALAGMAVFARGCTVEAFEVIVGPSLVVPHALDVLRALLRKALITWDDPAFAVRLTVREPLRVFARTKLQTIDGRDALEQRHARFYVEAAEKAARSAYGPGAAAALDALDACLPDLLLAFEREAVRAPALAARAALALGDLFLFRHPRDARPPLLARARAVADASADPELRARARILDAKMVLEPGRGADAKAWLVEATALARAAHLADTEADARRSLAWAHLADGEGAQALTELDRALERHTIAGDVRAQADALAAKGLAMCLGGDHEDAARAFALALDLHRGAGDAIRFERVREMASLAGVPVLAPVAAPSPEEPPTPGRISRRWAIGDEARWIRRPDGGRTDLGRYGSLRRVLAALVAHRIARPGVPLSAGALLSVGWPGERPRHESGMLRVYTTVRRLRRLALEAVLLTRDDGYLLDPAEAFEIVSES